MPSDFCPKVKFRIEIRPKIPNATPNTIPNPTRESDSQPNPPAPANQSLGDVRIGRVNAKLNHPSNTPTAPTLAVREPRSSTGWWEERVLCQPIPHPPGHSARQPVRSFISITPCPCDGRGPTKEQSNSPRNECLCCGFLQNPKEPPPRPPRMHFLGTTAMGSPARPAIPAPVPVNGRGGSSGPGRTTRNFLMSADASGLCTLYLLFPSFIDGVLCLQFGGGAVISTYTDKRSRGKKNSHSAHRGGGSNALRRPRGKGYQFHGRKCPRRTDLGGFGRQTVCAKRAVGALTIVHWGPRTLSSWWVPQPPAAQRWHCSPTLLLGRAVLLHRGGQLCAAEHPNVCPGACGEGPRSFQSCQKWRWTTPWFCPHWYSPPVQQSLSKPG